MYICAETWGLCDFRRTTGPRETIDAAALSAKTSLKPCPVPFLGVWGTEVDPGEWINVGDWMSAQDGMVSGPYPTRAAAKRALARSRQEDFTSDPGNVGRVVKVLHRYKGLGVTQVLLSV